VFGIATGFAPNYATLLCLRTLLGFGVGGATISFDLMAEFLPKSARGQFLTNINYFWTAGSMFVAGCAWVMLSSQGWHRLAIVTSLPVALSLVFAIGVLPESPRWLLLQGRVSEAEEVVRLAAVVNGSSLPPFSFRAPSLSLDDTDEHGGHKYHDKRATSTAENFSGFAQGHMLYISVPLWIIWVMFGLTYYGIILLTARLYQHSNEDDDGFVCDFDYADIFYSAASEVAGVALTALVVDR
jgi:MFS family permease